MADRWEPGFDVYSAEVADGRALFLVDLKAAEHAPVASHPVRFQLRVALQRPRPDGLRTEDEADALYAVEDRVVPAVERTLGGIYVGRYVAGGTLSFVFYLPEDAPEAALPAALGELSPYQPEWASTTDPEWEFFFDILMPGEYSMAEIENRRQLAHMQELGDVLEAPREIDHYAYFDELEAAARAAAELRRHGFRVDELDSEGDRVAVVFHRTDHCAAGRADEISYEILDIILEEGGDYDGWGAPLMVRSEQA